MLIRNNRKAKVAVFIPGAAPGSERMTLEPGSVTALPDEVGGQVLEHEGNKRLLGCAWLEVMDESHGSRVLVRNTRDHKLRLEVPLGAEDLPHLTAPAVKTIEIPAGETVDVRDEFLQTDGARRNLEGGTLEIVEVAA